jgi:hypothetical protein
MTLLERRGARFLALLAIVAIVAAIVALLLPSWAHAQQSRSFYDSRGSFAGSATTRGKETTYTDRNGRFDGTAIRDSDGTTSFYDARGRFTGSSTNTAPRR